MKYVGIDIGGTNLKACLVNDVGNVLAVQKMKMVGINDAAKLAWTIYALCQKLCEIAGCTVEEVSSVGVGCPGAVEVRGGSVLYSCNLPFRNVPLRRLFHQLSPIPFYIENDANCAALGEYHLGAGRGSKRFVTVTLGTGIGGGIIHNGKIYHGSNGMAGEIGHMVVDMNGAPCPCGRKGCWEQYASANALKRLTTEAWETHPNSILSHVIAENDSHVSGQSAFMAARQGCPVGQDVCNRYLDYLAIGLVNLVNIFQPDTLAIGGGISNEEDASLLEPLRRRVERDSIPCNRDKMTRIVKAELGTDAGMLGAALLGKRSRLTGSCEER